MTRIKIDYKMELLNPMSVPDRIGSGRCCPSAIAKKNKVPKNSEGGSNFLSGIHKKYAFQKNKGGGGAI